MSINDCRNDKTDDKVKHQRGHRGSGMRRQKDIANGRWSKNTKFQL